MQIANFNEINEIKEILQYPHNVIAFDVGSSHTVATLFQNQKITTHSFEGSWNYCTPLKDFLMQLKGSFIFIIENYLNYAHQSNFYIGKANTTSELIGVLKTIALQRQDKVIMQLAVDMKNVIYKKVNNRYQPSKTLTAVLTYLGWTKLNNHQKDSLGHLVFYLKGQWLIKKELEWKLKYNK